jgi:NTP pyrophosphatase (non-canonical NTP hydrolase)
MTPEWMELQAADLIPIAKFPPILDAIITERVAQDSKWGPSTERKDVSLAIWNTALVEEVGEVARALLVLRGTTAYLATGVPTRVTEDHDIQHLRTELVQVAALAWAMIEALDSGTPVEL